MRRTRWKAVVFVALGTLAQGPPGAAGEPSQAAAIISSGPQAPVREESWGENVVSISGESLPVGIRLAIFTEHLVHFMRKHLSPGGKGISHVRLFLQGTGLEELDVATLTSLSEFYGEFNERQQERWRQAFGRKDHLPEDVGDSFVRERAEFVGSIFGRWLRQLQQEGHDTQALLQRIERTRARSGSYIMGGTPRPHMRR